MPSFNSSLQRFASLSSEDAAVRELCEANGLTEQAFVRDSHQLSSLGLFMSGLRDSACLSHFGGLTAICFINVPNLTSLSGLDGCCPGKRWIVVSSHVGCLLRFCDDDDDDTAQFHTSRINFRRCCFSQFGDHKLSYSHATTQHQPCGHGFLLGLESLNITECGLETTEGLEGLTGLTALHLSSNHLQSLDGVRGMTRLKKLWANDNRIKTVRSRQRGNDASNLRTPRGVRDNKRIRAVSFLDSSEIGNLDISLGMWPS